MSRATCTSKEHVQNDSPPLVNALKAVSRNQSGWPAAVRLLDSWLAASKTGKQTATWQARWC